MFYRYEARCGVQDEGYQGVFCYLSPSERRKWYCLSVPKWYNDNPNADSKAWFTSHGYEKYHEKMTETIIDFLEQYASRKFDVRLIISPEIKDIVSKGKTQCISTDFSYNKNITVKHFNEEKLQWV